MSGASSLHPVYDPRLLEGLHLLEADAGTGKTWTIAGLAVRALVERGLGIEQLLVVTFTNAAAAELAARIGQRIAQLERLLDDRLEGRAAAVDEPFCVRYAERLDDAAARGARSALRVALARIDEMAVDTIHGFCQRVIREHALSIGVPAELRARPDVADPSLGRLADWWREQARVATAQQLEVLALAQLAPEGLADAVRAIARQPLARVAPDWRDWRGVERELADARAGLGAAIARHGDELLQWFGVRGNADGRSFGVVRVQGWLERLREWCEAARVGAMPAEAAKLASGRFGERAPPPPIPAACDRVLEVEAALRQVPAWIAQELARDCDRLRGEALAQATEIGFDELLRVVRDALADPVSGPSLARALLERYPMALIDECQDTDALQWDIFRRVYVDAPAPQAEPPARATLVLVGDPKQAIYAFRGADVYSYLDAREAAVHAHRLGENQRSSPALIAAVNALYLGRERPFVVGEIGFAPAAVGARPRRAFSGGDAGQRAPMTLVRLEPEPRSGWLDSASAQRQSIDACTAEIARLLRGGARLGDRVLRPSDIAVLVNAHRQGSAIKRALAARGIGAAEVTRDSVLDTLECAELTRLIAAVAAPADPGALRSALATTLLGGAAQALLESGRDPGAALASAAAFARARDDWERHGPVAALRRLLGEQRAGERLAAVRDGDRRLANLMHLVELLGDDAEARRGPAHALRSLARRRAGGAGRDRESEELRLESDEDLVRILTVHKSKGLEFPVVFLPFAWAARAGGGRSPSTRHERAGKAGWRAVLDFTPDETAARQAAREAHAEDARVAYVALTRAEQRCYVFWGAANGAQFSPFAWLLAGLDPLDQKSWRAGSKEPPPLDAADVERALDGWRERAALDAPGAVVVVDTPTLLATDHGGAGATALAGDALPADASVAGPGLAGEALVARPWRGSIPPASITTSFTAIAGALSRGDEGLDPFEQESVERPDHDQQPQFALAQFDALVPPAADEARERGDRAPMRFRFPAGAQAGVCLHGLLEEARFDARLDRQRVAARLAQAGFAHLDAGEVAGWLDEVVAAPLRAPGGETIRLAEVEAARQLREMDFLLRGDGVVDGAVVEAVDDEFGLDALAGAARWSGYLRGFIDLVFAHGGRYYLLDWKSNRLGDAPRDYGSGALASAMRAHAYSLQASLYTLALHRWLRRTLPGYDYERDFGGVFYVFLRGAGLAADAVGDAGARTSGAPDAPDAPGVPDAPGAPGVHASRPSRALVERLDRLFAPAAASRTR